MYLNSNKFILLFFWQHIKPFQWFYMLMFSATIVSSFHPFAYNYSIKLFLDNMSISDNLAYHDIILSTAVEK